MKYCVTVVRYGCLFVEAESIGAAIEIADHQKTETVNWSDDWEVTDAYPDDTAESYITEMAY